MTKNFCDHCDKEMNKKTWIDITYSGIINAKLIHRSVFFCEKCFSEIEREISKFIPTKAEVL